MDAIEYLHSKLDEKHDQLVHAVAKGDAKTYEEYRFLVGQIRGILTAKQTVTDLATLMETQNDD